MTKSTTTSILKLAAILVFFLGLILLTRVFCQIHTVNGTTYKPLSHEYYFPLAVSFWGVVLFILSPILGNMAATKKD